MILWIAAALLAVAAVGFAVVPFLRPIRHGAEPADHDSAPDVARMGVESGNRGLVGATGRAPRRRALRALYRQRMEEIEEEYAAGILDASSRAEIERELARGLLDDFDSPQIAPTITGGGETIDTSGGGKASDTRHGGAGAIGANPGNKCGVGNRSDAGVGNYAANSGHAGIERHAETRNDAQTRDESFRLAGGVDHQGDPESAGRRWAWVLVAVGIPILALVVYLRVGEPQAQLLQEAHGVLELDPEKDRLEIDRWRLLLANRLEGRPDDAQSRYLLGHLYFRDGDYARAAEEFALAHASVGDDPMLDWAWLQALFLANGGWLDETGKVIAERLLQREPVNPMVLEIVAIDAYRRGDYRESVARFNQALGGQLTPVQRGAMRHFVAQARSMLGDLEPRIDVQLTTSEPPPESATLFVIARPVGGGMPYAVVRRSAAPLPHSVTLDDAVVMNPDLPLSAAERIEVVARISPSGAALRRPGDWEWVSEPLLIADRAAISVAARLRPPGKSAPKGSHSAGQLD